VEKTVKYRKLNVSKSIKIEKAYRYSSDVRKVNNSSQGRIEVTRSARGVSGVESSRNKHHSRLCSKSKTGNSLSVSCISTKGKKNPLKDLQAIWDAKTITSYRHTDFEYGCTIISKLNKQQLGGTTFRRNSNSCWELELATKKESLEVSFCEDFLVFRIDVKSPQKRTLEIAFMHWSRKLRMTMNTGREDFNDYFPVDLRAGRFEKKRTNISTLKLISKFNDDFVSETLKRLTPIKNAVHQAVIDKYKKFVMAMKPFISISALIRTIWCFAATPAVLGTRIMCELRDRLIVAFKQKEFDVLKLSPALEKFRERALNDLVQGEEADSWVSKACGRVGAFEKVLANERKFRK